MSEQERIEVLEKEVKLLKEILELKERIREFDMNPYPWITYTSGTSAVITMEGVVS